MIHRDLFSTFKHYVYEEGRVVKLFKLQKELKKLIFVSLTLTALYFIYQVYYSQLK